MYFPIGWPKVLNVPKCKQRLNDANKFESVVCNRDRVLFAILSNHTLSIWFCKPCLPITSHTRDTQSMQDFGENSLVQWKPDSSMLVVATTLGYLIFYKLDVEGGAKSGLYEQVDSPQSNLCRENVQLFTKETVPCLTLSVMTQVAVPGSIPAMVGIRDELMVTSASAQVWRYKWDGHLNRDYCLDLRRIPFCMDQQVSKAVPIVEANTFIVDIEYSPLVGGFSVVFNDGRAAFLTASSLKFDPNQTQGLWAPHLDDVQCSALNHKYRLIAFGRSNGQTGVYVIDEHTGGLVLSHSLIVSDKVYTGELGAVSCMRYTPDGRSLALAWSGGGFSLWSTFGTLLVCSLAWDYGLRTPGPKSTAPGPPLLVRPSMEWAAEGYQLWMIRTRDKNRSIDKWRESQTTRERQSDGKRESATEMEYEEDEIIQYSFVKSVLATNPTMSHQSHLFLQGEDKLYINFGSGLSRQYQMADMAGPGLPSGRPETPGGPAISSSLIENKQWHVVSLPAAYAATNWPIRLAAIDSEGKHLAVAGRCGIAHYSLVTRKWKLFGNETQEKDMVVFGGLLWYQKSWIVLGCYSIPTETDELRFYPKDARLCNENMISVPVSGQVFLLENLRDRILTFTSDCRIYIYNVEESPDNRLAVTHIQSIDVSGLCVHPACIVSITLTSMRPEPRSQSGNINAHRPPSSNAAPTRSRDSFVMNVSGRLLLVHQFDESQVVAAPTVLASNVETIWAPTSPPPGGPGSARSRPHLTEALWLYCGVAGMRVWLPLFPRTTEVRPGLAGGNAASAAPAGAGGPYQAHQHSFISKRIMLPFQLNVYPLGILYEEAILLGVENDAALYSSADPKSVFSLPFSLLKRTSQVYIHQILRQLIRRNLGYHAWEIARACTSLPYFPHSLELLLHEVLEEEATSKEPIPDAQLPSVIEFIQEFPVYLSTIVQCARKTEIALWGYLFAAAGKPKDLFQQCLGANELETAASYLIILQNLESSSVSRQYATLLLDATLDAAKWDLAKDLVRFLRAIDPNEVESPRTSVIHHSFKFGGVSLPLNPPLAANEEDLSMLLGTMQVSRARSYSTTATPKIELQPMLSAPGNARHSLSETKPELTRSRKRSSTSNKSDKEASVKNGVPGTPGSGTAGTAEDFFMDLILQRHARRLLASHELKALGHFAATLDFHLVEWLAKERPRAARVDSFIVALKNLHTAFSWPYPNFSLTGGSISGGGRKTSQTSMSSIRSTSPNATVEPFKFGPLGLTGASRATQGPPELGYPPGPGSIVGDSGYMSQHPVLQPHCGLIQHGDERSRLSEDTVTSACYNGASAANGGVTSPYGGTTSPYGSPTSPYGGRNGSFGGPTSPYGSPASPYAGGPTSPYGGLIGTFGTGPSLFGGANGNFSPVSPPPYGTSPHAAENGPYGGGNTAYGGTTSPFGSGNIYGGVNSPTQAFGGDASGGASVFLSGGGSYGSVNAAAGYGGGVNSGAYGGIVPVSPWMAWPGADEMGEGGGGVDGNPLEVGGGGGSAAPVGLEWADIPCTQVLDQLSKQITSRGSSKAEVQLRYLLQIFMEAGCLEWTFIIAVLLRDAMAIHRISNAARSHEQSYEAVLRLKDGFVALCQWSHSECLGYKPFLIAVQAQLTILNKLLALKSHPSSPAASPLPPSLSSTSLLTPASMMGGPCDDVASGPVEDGGSGGGPPSEGVGGGGGSVGGSGGEEGQEAPSGCVVM